jgi:hypothetical protein
VLKAYRQANEALIDDRAIEIGDNGGNAWQFTKAVLRRYFPDRGGADENAVTSCSRRPRS